MVEDRVFVGNPTWGGIGKKKLHNFDGLDEVFERQHGFLLSLFLSGR